MKSKSSSSPLLNTPVREVSRVPRWVHRRSSIRLPKWLWDYSSALFDHQGESIIDGRRALISEPYSRGSIRHLELAADFAEQTDTELRICLPTWHGFGTMRFAWLAPSDIAPPKYLIRFVEIYVSAADAIRRLSAEISGTADRELLAREFWTPLWDSIPQCTSAEARSIQEHARVYLRFMFPELKAIAS